MASTDKCFVIAVGGTGMRCLESFTHMCAMGMFDSKEIDILTLDTDQLNGKKEKVDLKIARAVWDKYQSLRRPIDKQKFQIKISKSYKDMLSALKESIDEFGLNKEQRCLLAKSAQIPLKTIQNW